MIPRRLLGSRAPLLAVIATGALLLAGCETETPYRPAVGHGFNNGGGYSDRQIEANRFQITFSGNTVTSRDTVEKYLLYRAAELTVQHGDDYFILADRNTDKQTRTYATPGPYGGPWGPGPWGGWGASWRFHRGGFGWRSWDPFWGDPWGNDFDIQTVDRYEASAEIITGKGPPPPRNIHAFDAHQVMEHLGPSIVMPK
jgi:hypothetical protein